MNSNPGIIGAGNWIVDKTKIIDVYPAQDTLANIESEERNNGGGAYNILCNLSNLGVHFPLCAAGLIGQDSEGDWIIDHCHSQDIDTKHLARHHTQPTSYTDVMTVRSTGRRTFFHQRGANRFFGADYISWEHLQGRIFYLGYLMLLDAMDAPDADHGTVAAGVLAQAGRRGFYRVVDLVSVERPDYREIVHPSLPHIDLLICNELEASRVTGVVTRNADDDYLPAGLVEAAKTLLENGINEWVVIHLPEGTYARSVNGVEVWQGRVRLPSELIIGAAGAGDAFAAGLLLGFHDAVPIQQCLNFGVCAAAASLRSATTSASVTRLDECLALGEKYGYLAFPSEHP